jgi:hypothetical protein
VWRTELPPVLDRPLEQGQGVGTARLIVEGQPDRMVELVATRDVPAPEPAARPSQRVGAALQQALRAFVLSAEIDRAA